MLRNRGIFSSSPAWVIILNSLTTIKKKKKKVGVLVLLLPKGYYATFSILLFNEKKSKH
jgi:hypothetical protein